MRRVVFALSIVIAGLGAASARAETLLFYVTRSAITAVERDPAPLFGQWARLFAEASGLTVELRVLDFGKSFASVQQRPDACVVGMIRTPEREALVNWITPVFNDVHVIVGRPDEEFRGSLDDLDRVAAGSVAAPEGALFDLLKAKGVRAIRVADHDATFALVKAGRVRFGLTTGLVLRAAGGTGQFRPVLDLGPTSAWLACGKSMPAAVLARLRAAELTLEGDPRMQDLRRSLTADVVAIDS